MSDLSKQLIEKIKAGDDKEVSEMYKKVAYQSLVEKLAEKKKEVAFTLFKKKD